MEEDQYEIELIVKDFELILMVFYDDEMMKILLKIIDRNEVMYGDLIDLFVVMNVEMN
jgi:hypothetical protein